MAYIKTMKDINGKTIYPQTHAQAVYASDGMTLEAKLNGLPTKISEFENDTGFITNTVDNLTNYYKKTELYTQTEVNNLINAITTMNVEVVTALPTENISTTTIYLKAIEGEGDNNHEEWLYANGAWELIGTTAIDLTPYATKEYVDNSIKNANHIKQIIALPEPTTIGEMYQYIGETTGRYKNGIIYKTVEIPLVTGTFTPTANSGQYYTNTTFDANIFYNSIGNPDISKFSSFVTYFNSYADELMTIQHIQERGVINQEVEYNEIVGSFIYNDSNDAAQHGFNGVNTTSAPTTFTLTANITLSIAEGTILRWMPCENYATKEYVDEWINKTHLSVASNYTLGGVKPGNTVKVNWPDGTMEVNGAKLNLSTLNNDIGFITQDDIDLTNYYTKTETNGLIPTATSKLTNDSDFTTNANVEEAFDNLAFKTLVHTDANPIDFNNITEPGVYVIKNIGQTTLNAPEFFTDVGNVIGFNVILIVTHKLSQESAVYTWQELICGNSSKTISNHYSRVGTGAWSELQIPAGQIKAGTLNAGILCPTPSSSMSDLQIANKAYVDAKFAELKTYIDNALAKVAYISES